jgi:hypothetical protein
MEDENMNVLKRIFPIGSIYMIVCLVLTASTVVIAEEKLCDYDKLNPTLKKAQAFYKANNHDCSRRVLYDFLRLDTLSSLDIAEAHIWIGMANFTLWENKPEQYDSVFTHFLAALMSYPGYRGTLSKDSTSDIGVIFMYAKDSLSRIEEWQERRKQDSLQSICLQYNKDKKKLRFYRIITGIGIAGATAGGLLFNANANDAYDRYQSAIDPDDIRAEWDDYKSKYNMRNIMIGAAAILAISEAYWFFKKPEKPQIDCTALSLSHKIGEIGLAKDAIGIELSIYIPGS